jgi:hypothetical protein
MERAAIRAEASRDDAWRTKRRGLDERSIMRALAGLA